MSDSQLETNGVSDMFKIENVKLAGSAIYTPAKSPALNHQQYFIYFWRDENETLDGISWRPSKMLFPKRESASFKSNHKPMLDFTFENGDSYKDLLHDLQVADARNIGRDYLIRGAVADINLTEDGYLLSLQIQYRTMMNPHLPLDAFRI